MKKKRSLGVRVKLILIIIPIVFVMIATFFAIARSTIIQLSMDRLAAKSTIYAEDIGGWVGEILSELTVYKDTIEKAGFQNDEEILAYLETSLDIHEAYPVGLYMGDDSGVYLDGSGWVPGDDWVLTERDWYVDGVDNETFAFGEPYYDSQSGDNCVSASVRMDYKKAVRVLAVDVYLDYISELVEEMMASDMDIAFFVTKGSHTILAHPDTEMIATTLSQQNADALYTDIENLLVSEKVGEVVEAKGKQGRYYVGVYEIEGTDWYLVTGMAKSRVLAELYQLEIIIAALAVVATFLLIVLSLNLMNGIVKPVKKVTNVLDNVAEGDFTRKIEVKGSDEIANMGRNMQYFMEKMRNILIEISGTAERLDEQSQQNGTLSETLEDSSAHQMNAVQILNSTVEDLMKAAERVAEEVERLAEAAADAEERGNHAGSVMNETVSASESGKQAMQRVKAGMDSIEQTIGTLSEQIAQASEVTKNIDAMVNTIKDIADETNLLSLNASIEAARAGEAGRGFAVVAEQISSLAASSKNAADTIEKLTLEISDTMGRAAEQMKISVADVTDNSVVVTETSDIFHTVFEKVSETNTTITRMVGLVSEIDRAAVQLNDIVGTQVKATQQIEVAAKEMENHTETVSSNSKTVAENARKLKQESKDLAERMRQFTV